MSTPNLGIVSSLPPQTTTQAQPSAWQSILSNVASFVGQTAGQVIQAKTAAKIATIQQKASVSAYGGQTTAQAIEAINQQRILEATIRARDLESATGTTAGSIGGISTTTLMIVAGLGLGIVMLTGLPKGGK
jgi:hypothetical protein